MNIEAIAVYLAQNDCGAIGKTIFVSEMPTDGRGVLLIDSYKGTQINHDLPGYFVTEFRVVVRSTEYTVGMALAKKVSRALTSHQGFVADTLKVKQCLPVNLPRVYRRSVGGFWEAEVDVEIVFTDISA